MEAAEYERMFALEERHFWFVAKRRLVGRLLARALPEGGRILDVGCGTGQTLRDLSARWAVAGVDREPLALSYCRRRGLRRLARAAVGQLPFASDSFDGALLLDVLYHRGVADEAAALAEVARVVRPGGVLVLTDSALEMLRSPHDEATHGRRRYRVGEIRALLEGAGLRVEKCAYTNLALLPALLAIRLPSRLRRRPRSDSDLRPLPGVVNAALTALCTAEAAIAARADLPIGSSVVAVARRPGAPDASPLHP